MVGRDVRGAGLSQRKIPHRPDMEGRWSDESNSGLLVDEAAFRTLFGAHFDDLWAFARRRCRSAEQADDVAAETFAVAWRRRDDLASDEGTRLWLFGTARLVLANQRRTEGREAGLRERLGTGRPAHSVVDPADLAVSDHADHVWSALASLNLDDRDLLIMRAWDELAVTDMAVLLGCTPNAVSIRLHRARGRLAAALDQSDPPDSRTSSGRPGSLEGDAP